MIMHALESGMRDARYALRTLRRSPAFSIVALLTLALGIGSTTAAFSVVDNVVLRGLPYRDPSRLQTVYERSDEGGFRVPSYPTFRDWQAQSASVSSAIEGMAYVRGDGIQLPLHGSTERRIGAYVTPGFFALMGTRPLLGRGFLPDEERLGAAPVAVLSYDYFVEEFGGNPATIGKVIDVDSVPTTIIGVMPHAFAYPNFAGSSSFLGPSMWQPLTVFERTHPQLGFRGLHVDSRALLRLRSGTDSARAATAMRTIGLRLAAEYPVEQAHWASIAIQPIASEMFGGLRSALAIISSAIALVLLLACANVANLMLTRASARRQEMTIRAALGAGWWRLARQLLAEALVLAIGAGALGLVLAYVLVGYVRGAATSQLPFASELSVDGRAALFALLASGLTAILVGTLPALHAGSVRLMERVRAGGAGAIGGAREAWVRNVLVSLQFALALTLLMGAGLLIQSFRRLVAVPLGYDPRDMIEFSVSPPAHRYQTPAEAAALWTRIIEAVRAVPGVTDVAAAGGALLPTKVETEAATAGRATESALYHTVSSDFRQTMRIPMVAGRWFTSDDMRSPVGFVISEKLAKRIFPSASALGQRVTVRRASQARKDFGQPITLPIIGVISDIREYGPETDSQPEIYLPYTLEVWPWMQFVVRAPNAPRALPSVDRAVRGVEPALDFLGKPSVSSTGVASIDPQRRFVTLVLVGFAGCALLLATVGLYGTVAYNVIQRTRELGVRIALGATEGRILALVMRDGLAFVLAGAVAGVLGAIVSARLIRAMLFETTATDATTFVAVPAVLALAALAASYLSARRAAKTDPLVAIRGE
jgi:putative ABC transport system permease protein